MIVAANDEQRANCPMIPNHLVMQTPEEGFMWLEGEDFHEDCDPSLEHEWNRFSSPTYDLCVSTEGPYGSGRYWTITVGLAENQEINPGRGFCLSTSTVGWRTLQSFHRMPLPWIADLNEDGKPELIIWTSFSTHENSSSAEFGLMAWIYKVDSDGIFTIDWPLSRQMAREIAMAYRKPSRQKNAELQDVREKLAIALETFAGRECQSEGGYER